MKNKNFCAFILSHGRPDNVKTYTTLQKMGYTGRVIIVIDNEDKTSDKYYDNFGKENVYMFDKKAISKTFDEVDNFDDRRTIVYARNACFEIAKELNIENFVQLDDDYYWFGYRTENGAKTTRNLNGVFDIFVDFLNNSSIDTVAFSQGGDHIGGFNPEKKIKRKAMNSFFCSTKKPFKFIGRINEDVNTYVKLGSLGKVFCSVMNFQLDQKDTQSNEGGMSSIYEDKGTYIKSFYSVITNPSSVKVKMMTTKYSRLHHSINWDNTTPQIIQQIHKK